MLEDKLRELQAAIAAKRTEAQAAWTKFAEERDKLKAADVDITDPNSPAVVAADEAMKPYSKAADELRVLEGQFERISMMQVDGGDRTRTLNAETDHDRSPIEARETFGQQVVQGERYQELHAAGRLQRSGLETHLSEPMEREVYASLLTGQSPSAGGVLVEPKRLPGIYDLPRLALGVFDLLTVAPTDDSSVEYVRLLARTIRAAEVGEAATAADIDGVTVTAAAGGQKPESDLTFEILTATAQIIAHWIPATRNQLANAPVLRALIDAELRTGVQRRMETQAVQGDGVGNNIRGIYNIVGISSYTQGSAAGAVGEPYADAVHRTYTQLRLGGFEPSGTLIDPRDWQEIRLFKDDNGNYQFGPPSIAGAKQLWGITAVESIAAVQGSPLSGEWARAMFLIFQGIQVLVSDSHKDWFTRNILALLAEASALLLVPRPQAFGKTVFA